MIWTKTWHDKDDMSPKNGCVSRMKNASSKSWKELSIGVKTTRNKSWVFSMSLNFETPDSRGINNQWVQKATKSNSVRALETLEDPGIIYPIGSMYGIFAYIYHKNQPNVGKYTIHGSYGYDIPVFTVKTICSCLWPLVCLFFNRSCCAPF